MDKDFISLMMEVLLYLYHYDGEFLHDFVNQECYIHYNGDTRAVLNIECLNFMLANNFIELDTGNHDPQLERMNYKLTDKSKQVIKRVLLEFKNQSAKAKP